MRFSNRVGLRQQVQFLQRQFLQDGDLPFTDVLSTEVVSQALTTAEVEWKDRIYAPLMKTPIKKRWKKGASVLPNLAGSHRTAVKGRIYTLGPMS